MWDGRATPMRSRIAVVAALALLAALPSTAGAVLSGTNGRIAFTSGRTMDDNHAQIFLRTTIGSAGGGTISAPLTPVSFQSRHASWSPDRTQLVLAAGTPGSPTTEHYDLLIKELPDGSLTQLANSNTNTADHPAWSPDGTRIAYEEAPSAGSADRDIKVKVANSIATPPMTLTSTTKREFKAAWTPDSQTIYYAQDNGPTQGLDIVKQAAGGGAIVPVQAASGIDEYQPSISPDGTKMCFTLQTTIGNSNSSNIYVADLPTPGFLLKISQDNATGNINCTWSPDGTLIAYVRGTFGSGELVMARADGTSPSPITLAQDANSNKFDGNPDWAPDGRPVCPDSTVTTKANQPIAIPLECTDTGPAYERTPVNESISNDGAPSHGSVGPATPGDPSSVTYTPNQDFVGTDTIKFIGRDDFGFGSDRGTVTIDVKAPTTTDTTPPTLFQLLVKPATFKFKKTTKVSFQLSEPATVTFRVLKRGAGRKVNGKCKPLTKKNRKRRKCDLTLSGSIVRAGKVGANKFTFNGKLKGKRLGRGKYFLVGTAKDAAGNKSSPPQRAKFTIKK
jgi:Tol biopolymer transport system component